MEIIGTTIHINRGNICRFDFEISKPDGSVYEFKPGDIIRFVVCSRNKPDDIKIQKNFIINEQQNNCLIELESSDTKIDGVINKPLDYWYEIILNPDTKPQTVLGYDKDGPKIFKLYPETSSEEEK